MGLGPCLASCGPLLVSYTAGTQKNVSKSIWAYLIFSLGRIAVYAVLGVGIFFFGQLINRLSEEYLRYIFILGGIFIGCIGILMAIGLDFKACRTIRTFFLTKDALTIFILGLVMGLLPCLPLLSALSYIGLISKSWYISLSYSLAFGLGTLLSPLFLISALSGLIPRINIGNEKFYKIISVICGFVIVFLGVQLVIRGFMGDR